MARSRGRQRAQPEHRQEIVGDAQDRNAARLAGRRREVHLVGQQRRRGGEAARAFLDVEVVRKGRGSRVVAVLRSVSQIIARRSASANGARRSSTASTTLKIAVFAPMPRPSVTMQARRTQGS
jgi:hypothetical protein